MTDTQNPDCKHCARQSLRCRASLALRLTIGCWIAMIVCPTGADESRSQVPPDGEQQNIVQDSQPPELSLESLFHPKKKHKFAGTVPTTHWLADTPPVLLIKREKRWTRFDVNSGVESPWPLFDQLTEQLSALQGLQADQVEIAAMSAAGKMKRSDDTVLARVDGSLAVVSARAPARWLTREAKNWGNATLDPLGRRVAYTNEGDLFVVDVATGRSLRMTRDGSDTLLDGVLDWTYQEEIFGRGNYKGFWFSPDGEWLAMLRIDISGIEPYTLPLASSARGQGIVRRYPKAGDPIPHASLLVWDLREFDKGVVPPPRQLVQSTPQKERIITGVWWHEHRRVLLYSVSDRLQTWRELRCVGDSYLLDGNERSELLLREESPAWVEPPAKPGCLPDGSVVWRSELPTGRNRLFVISPDGAIVTPISPENFDVQDFFVRADGSFAIVTGDAVGGTVERHAYRIDLKTAPTRISPLQAITSEPGWHSTKISPVGEFTVDSFSNLTQPPRLLLRGTLDGQSKPIDSAVLKLGSDLIPPELFRITTNEGIELPAMMIRPPNASQNQPCPVLIEVYGGPQAPVVSARWSGTKTLYRELLARRGIATLVVDNRSSAGRGIADTWSVRGRLGEVELQDLLSAVDWLKSQPWVDSQRIAIRGWSFGGFLTLYAMTHSDVFAAGIAGGSVTDWREYDAFYTERYMGLPSENPDGYRSTAPVSAAANLHGRVLLIHGESDDNVHPSGTMRMVDALQRAGKDFDMMIYPGAAHAVHQPSQLWHMTRLTDQFLLEQLLAGEK